jgi:hypothetical protein
MGRMHFAPTVLGDSAIKVLCRADVVAATLPRGASGDRNILGRQSLIDRNRKVATHLDPVFVPLRPRAKVKAHRS